MSVIVRTVMANPVADDDKRIGWIDRPLIGDVTHESGRHFTVLDGLLYVWEDETVGKKSIAVYHHWYSAVVDTPTLAARRGTAETGDDDE